MGWIGATAIEIAEAVAGGRATAVEVVREHLDHIEATDPRVGAFVLVRREEALAEAAAVDALTAAERADRRLAGVPVAIKDVADVTGHPTRNGSLATSSSPATQDDVTVQRLRAAGAIVVGKTRCPELCVFGNTDTSEGPARNPWNLARTPGGSSGGSAAAVAAGMVPVALASDGMGSIRIPASCCGLFGIKPGSGVVPMHFAGQEGHWSGMSQYGPVATTVADGALFLDVLAGGRGLDHPSAVTGSWRVGWSHAPMIAGTVVTKPWKAGVEATVGRLREAGHAVVRQKVPMTTGDALAMIARWTHGAEDDLNALGLDRDRVQARVRGHAAVGRAMTRVMPIRESQARAWKAKVADMFEAIDVLVLPGLLRTPPQADGWRDKGWLPNALSGAWYASLAGPWNFADVPAAVVPVGVAPDGLPVTVQVVGPHGAEDRVLAFAAHLEELRPWRRHAPMVDGAVTSGS